MKLKQLKHIIKEEISKVLNEASYNYHVSKFENDGSFQKPYGGGCDNKYNMSGRGTGHFGSGTYFATFKEHDFDKLGDKDENSPFIQIDDRVYRVDFDFYRNLYRVYDERQGNVLHSMLSYVNGFYYVKSDYKSILYQKIERSAEYLGLDCPSYRQLISMAKELENDKSRYESFSTMFMEYNGYNGVNVSGVPSFDNTKFGSVIYDLNKTSLEAVPPKFRKHAFTVKDGASLNTTVHRHGEDSIIDKEMEALEGKVSTYSLKHMPFAKVKRILKNFVYGGGGYDIRELDSDEIDILSDRLQKYYLKLLYSKFQSNLDLRKISDAILKHNAYYWVNYLDKNYQKSGLISLMQAHYGDLDWNLPDEQISKEMTEYYNNIRQYLERNLAYFEIPLLQKFGVNLDV